MVAPACGVGPRLRGGFGGDSRVYSGGSRVYGRGFGCENGDGREERVESECERGGLAGVGGIRQFAGELKGDVLFHCLEGSDILHARGDKVGENLFHERVGR